MRLMKKLLSSIISITLIASMLYGSFVKNSVKAESNGIAIGDKIELGTYNGKALTWVCGGFDENGALMIAEDVICNKSYDAASNNYSESYRRGAGSNYWDTCCLKTWLNSKGEIDWSTQSAIPSDENVRGSNGYEDEKGFLSSFTDDEMSRVKKVTQKTYINSLDSQLADGGKSKFDYNTNSIDNMLSTIGGDYWYKNTTEYFFPIGPEQIKTIKESLPDLLKASSDYWTRQACNTGMSYENISTITKDMTLYYARAYDSTIGVRPAFYIKNENRTLRYGINNTYSFENPTVDLVGYKYWRAFLGPAAAKLLSSIPVSQGKYGICFGMALTASTSNIYDYPSVSSYGIDELSKASKKTKSSETTLTAIDFIKYGFAAQALDPFELHTNSDLNDIMDEIKDFTFNKGEPMVLKVRSHALCPLGIKSDNDEFTEVIIYDCNVPLEEKLLKVYKKNGKYTSWEYEWKDTVISSDDYLLESVKINSLFMKAMDKLKANGYNATMMNLNDVVKYTSLIKTDNLLMNIASETYTGALTKETNTQYVKYADLCAVDENGLDNYLFYLNNEKEKDIVLSTPNKTSSCSIANDNDLWEMNVPSKTEITVSNDSKKVDIKSSGQRLTSVTHCDVTDKDNISSVSVSGNSNEMNISVSEQGLIVKSSSLTEGEVKVSVTDEDGNIKNEVTMSLPVSSDDILIEANDTGATINSDPDGDGTYDNEIISETFNQNDVESETISLIPTSVLLEKGKFIILTATIEPSNATDKTVTWTSSNPSVATVNNGKITAVKAGTATITASTTNGKTATCKVTVKGLSDTKLTIYKGKKAALALYGVKGKITWKTSKKTIAVVSTKGKVTAKKKGTVDIYVYINGKKSKYQCKVTVKNPTLKINKTKATIKKGKTYQIAATPTPAATVSYKTSNKKIATVSKTGLVKGIKKGTATITVKANGVTKKVKITVKN